MQTYTTTEVIADQGVRVQPLLVGSRGSLNAGSDSGQFIIRASGSFSAVVKNDAPQVSYKTPGYCSKGYWSNMCCGAKDAANALRPQFEEYQKVISLKILQGLKVLITSARDPHLENQDCCTLYDCVTAADPSFQMSYFQFESFINLGKVELSSFNNLIDAVTVGLEKLKGSPEIFSPTFFTTLKLIFDKQQTITCNNDTVQNSLGAVCEKLSHIRHRASFDDLCTNSVSLDLYDRLSNELIDLSNFALKMIKLSNTIDRVLLSYSAYRHEQIISQLKEIEMNNQGHSLMTSDDEPT